MALLCPWAIERASALIQPARPNGHDSYVYLESVLTRLPTLKTSSLAKLLPHNWVPASKV